MTRIPILTYHPMNISGNSYDSNDHVALATDLELLSRNAINVVSLHAVVDALLVGELASLGRCVAITFDDGSNFDYFDLPHPTWGLQRGMLTILSDAARSQRAATLEATSFVIVSPEARGELDRKCMIGAQWWTDDWWAVSERSGRLKIESHSWDHNHDALDATVTAAHKGTFDIARLDDADREIADANHYLCTTRGRPGPVLFAYPYGQASAYVSGKYFPRGQHLHGVKAAFTTAGSPVDAASDRWLIPRFVCGWHWKSADELDHLLRTCSR